jgi:hypothetical protein
MNPDKMIEASDAIVDLLQEKVGNLEQLDNMMGAIALLEIVKHSMIAAAAR